MAGVRVLLPGGRARGGVVPILARQASAFALLATAMLAAPLAAQQAPQVPYVPTPHPVVRAMLQVAQVDSTDVVYDLGSGDGRIVIAAAQRYGARGLGVDIDAELVSVAMRNAQSARVDDRVEFRQQDLFELDISPASVVTLYLLSNINLRLRPRLLAELRPGSRVVSHAFDMRDWEADSVFWVPHNGSRARVYFWIVPVQVGGRWTLEREGGEPLELELELAQRFQMFEGQARGAGEENALAVTGGRLRGVEIAFSLASASDASPLRLRGRVDGDVMAGTEEGSGRRWTARRIPE